VAAGRARSVAHGERGGWFPATSRSALLGARSADAAERHRSLAVLAEVYWRPVYMHVRLRWAREIADAEDLTQAFFARALEKDFFAAFDPGKARFRTFMRVCVDRFIRKQIQASGRIKRGGAASMVSLDVDAVERDLAAHGAGEAISPEERFDREWVRALLSLAVDALRAELQAQSKAIHLRLFERRDLEGDDATYEALAAEYGVKLTDVTNYLAAARREFRRILLRKLGELTTSDDELREEARSLFGIDLG
jgi:RNA polymerase sigma factor (sigma-70 family)